MAMTGGNAYLVKSEKANYGSYNWTTDLYIYVKIVSQNVVANTSTIALGMYVHSLGVISWGDFAKNGTSYIGTATSGSNCFTFSEGQDGTGTKWLIENKQVTVSHNSDGTLTLPIYWHWGVSSAWGQYIGPSGSYNVTLTTIDRAAPTVSASVSNITANSFKISAFSSGTASRWWYSLDGGSSWTEFGSEGTYKEITVTGLTPNTTYSVQVSARKKSNEVNGYSGKSSHKTLGGTVITSASSIDADSDTVNVVMRLTVYDSSFYHKLSIKNGGTTVLTTAAFKLSVSGSVDLTKALTSAERTALLNAMSTVKSFTGTLSLVTYNESSCTNQIGNASTLNVMIRTRESVSRPIFTDFSYYDERELIMGITGNQSDRTIMIQTYSKLVVAAQAGTPKNGATIKSYSASIGNVAKTVSGQTIQVGSLEINGSSVELIVSCIDSRGYSTSVTKHIKVLKYDRPRLDSVTIRRKDEIEDIIKLSFRGSFSSLKPDGSTEINSLRFAGFYYKKTDETSWSDWCSVKSNVTTTGSSFSYSTDQLMLSTTEPLSLNTEASYDFWLLIRDQLDSYTSCDDYSIISQGKPLVSFRKRNSSYDFNRVGINNPHPEEALDVAGNIAMNGIRVLGYVGKFSGYFSSCKKGGVYLYDATTASSDAPSMSPGILEVLSDGENVIQRFTALAAGGVIYIRACIASESGNTWTAWTCLQSALQAHPVGSYYISDNATNPKNLFGGTWVQVKDIFLLAAGDTYNAGSTGGAATHTLTANEMPVHNGHLLTGSTTQSIGTAESKYLPASSLSSYGSVGRGWNKINSNEMMPAGISAGGGAAHNNMPPYLVVYVWRRTA